MSKAVICDACKKAITEQSATHVETKWTFIISHYDLCPDCIRKVKTLLFQSKEAGVAAPTSENPTGKARPMRSTVLYQIPARVINTRHNQTERSNPYAGGQISGA